MNRAALVLLLAAFPRMAGAIGMDEIVSELSEIEKKIDALDDRLIFLQKEFAEPMPEAISYKIQRRMNDGQVLFGEKDYVQASIIFFDVLETPGIESHPGYADALYYLGESLYQNRNYLASRHYFQKLAERGTGAHLQDAVGRLLEIAFKTRNYESVDRIYSMLLSNPAVRIVPELAYLYAKSLYNRGDLSRAMETFAAIPREGGYYFQAQYFGGMILVKQGRNTDAVAVFQQLKQDSPKTAEERKVIELAHLALGRLYYEIGKLDESAGEYQEISQDSEYFNDYLYEIAWTMVRKGSFDKAIRSLDMLLLSMHDAGFVPETQVLKGNLYLKMDNFEKAIEAFEGIVDTYKPVKEELDNIVTTQTPADLLEKMGGEQGEINMAALMPSIAMKWATAEEDVREALSVTEDMGTSKSFLEDSDLIVEKLLILIPEEGPGQYEAFPVIREAKKGAVEVENGVIALRDRLGRLETSIVESGVGREEMKDLENIREEKAGIEKAFQSLPKTKEEIDRRDKAFTKRVAEFEMDVYKSSYKIDAMRIQLDAIQKWYNDSLPKLKGDPKVKAAFQQKLTNERRVIVKLMENLKSMQNEIAVERLRMGGVLSKEDELRIKYNSLLERERDLAQQVRIRLSAEMLAMMEKVDAMREKVETLGNEVNEFTQNLNKLAAAKAVELRREIMSEKKLVEGYKTEIRKVETEAREMAAQVAYSSIKDARDHFRNILLEADVGILDVVWKRKQLQSEKIRSIADRQSMEEGRLEEEFKELMKKEEEKEARR